MSTGRRRAQAAELPPAALLQALRQAGQFTDCYTLTVPQTVDQAGYIEAFFTSRLFKAERLVLRWLARRPSTDAQVQALAQGRQARFAVWQVSRQHPGQLLMSDESGRTSTWLMAEPLANGAGTRLYFGSAIVARRRGRGGPPRFSPLFHALLPLHALYSRRLLEAAARGLGA